MTAGPGQESLASGRVAGMPTKEEEPRRRVCPGGGLEWVDGTASWVRAAYQYWSELTMSPPLRVASFW
jgi:hypothetical protein